MDPRAEQLVVLTAVLESLLQQKSHYECENQLEVRRLQRFKSEGVSEHRLRMQEQVIKRVEGMLGRILRNLRGQQETCERFMSDNADLKASYAVYHQRAVEVLRETQHSLRCPT